MSTEAKKPLKGILKRPKKSPATPSAATHTLTTTTSDADSNTDPNKPDARAIAIHHARLLEDRKAAEITISDNIITLLDFPLHPSQPPASRPDPSDVKAFSSLLRLFQPSDYDDLITERNLSENRCGYALCPRKRRRFPGAGIYKMINKGRKDFDIVETRELERWCSSECTRRALWIKVQLSETAAWERAGLPELKIELYPEKETAGSTSTPGQEKQQQQQQQPCRHDSVEGGEGRQSSRAGSEELTNGLASLKLREEEDKAQKDIATLALERGDDAKGSATRSVDVVIREKAVITQAEAPSLSDNIAAGDSIEGYTARFKGGDKQPLSGKESDEDSDWGL